LNARAVLPEAIPIPVRVPERLVHGVLIDLTIAVIVDAIAELVRPRIDVGVTVITVLALGTTIAVTVLIHGIARVHPIVCC
jgi:hypothetical protein